MPLRPPIPFAIAFVVSAALASAQNVLVVDKAGGPGSSFTEIQPAVDASAEGDVILVRSGLYAPFRVSAKSLSLVGDTGANVVIAFIFGPTPQCLVEDLGPEQRVEVRGFVTRVSIRDNEGPVWIESVKSGAGIAARGAEVFHSASVTFISCEMTGTAASIIPGAEGLASESSTVVAFDSKFQGGNGSFGVVGIPGGDGAKVQAGGSLFASGSTFSGGAGGGGSSFGAQGGDGLQIAFGTSGYAMDCSFIGGKGGSGFMSVAPDGQAIAGSVTALPGSSRHFTASTPVREFLSATLSFRGEVGETAAAIVGQVSFPAFLFLDLSGPVLVSLESASAFAFGPVGGDGSLDVSIPMPDFLPALQGGRLYFQSLFFDTALTYAVLGPASLFVLLDSAL